MSEIINARGLACPDPFFLTKRAMDEHDDVVVLVDNTTAVENIRGLASGLSYSVEVAYEPEKVFKIHLRKQRGKENAESA